MEKINLSSTNLYHGFVSHLAKLDLNQIQKNIVKNQSKKITLDDFDLKNQYSHYDWEINLDYLVHYIIDFANVEYNKTFYLTDKFNFQSLIVNPQELIQSHNFFDNYDIKNSPDYTLIFCVKNGETPINFYLDYTDHRDKDRIYKMPLETNRYIIFNSDLKFRTEKNKNKDNSYFLVLNFNDK